VEAGDRAGAGLPAAGDDEKLLAYGPVIVTLMRRRPSWPSPPTNVNARRGLPGIRAAGRRPCRGRHVADARAGRSR
jgi:hypothetical protein